MTLHPVPTATALSLAVTSSPEEETLKRKARALTEALGLSRDIPADSTPQFLLVYTPKGLELQTFMPEAGRYAATLTVDFVQGNTGYRRLHGGGIHQPLARAAGLKGGVRPTIVDATAGLGVDGFILATLGCRVTMIERSPIMWALLADGLERAACHAATSDIAGRIQLLAGDAATIITSLANPPATIYLDPMYPHRRGSALNKQEMRTIRTLVGDDQDATALLEKAFVVATNRVVVKRPKGAPELGTRKPSHIIEMKNSRFDVYLTNRLTAES